MTADLSALIARLETAEVGGRELDWDVGAALFTGVRGCAAPNATTSLDAALALAERVLPLWCAVAEWTPSNDHPSGNKGCASVHLLGDGGSGRVAAKTPALALCIAILRAKQGENT